MLLRWGVRGPRSLRDLVGPGYLGSPLRRGRWAVEGWAGKGTVSPEIPKKKGAEAGLWLSLWALWPRGPGSCTRSCSGRLGPRGLSPHFCPPSSPWGPGMPLPSLATPEGWGGWTPWSVFIELSRCGPVGARRLPAPVGPPFPPQEQGSMGRVRAGAGVWELARFQRPWAVCSLLLLGRPSWMAAVGAFGPGLVGQPLCACETVRVHGAGAVPGSS